MYQKRHPRGGLQAPAEHARPRSRCVRQGPYSPPIRDTRTSRTQRTSTTVAMTGSGRMLKRATLAVGEVTSGPAVKSTDTVDGDVSTTNEAPWTVAFARRAASLDGVARGTQTVAARQSLASVRARPLDSTSLVGWLCTIGPIIPTGGQEARGVLVR